MEGPLGPVVFCGSISLFSSLSAKIDCGLCLLQSVGKAQSKIIEEGESAKVVGIAGSPQKGKILKFLWGRCSPGHALGVQIPKFFDSTNILICLSF